MNDDELDALLRGIKVPDTALDDDAFDDDALRAFQAGDESDVVEDQLLESAELRAYAKGLSDPIPEMLIARLARLTPKPRARMRPWMLAAAAAVIIAAGAIMFRAPSLPGLPDYELEVSGYARVVRSGDDAPQDRYQASSSTVLRITLRPKTAVERPLKAGAFRSTEAGEMIPVPMTATPLGKGVFRLEIPAKTAFPTAGSWRLHLALGAESSTGKPLILKTIIIDYAGAP